MTDAAEVKVKLVVDSNSGKITQDMQKDMAQVDHSAKKAGGGIGPSFLKGVGIAAVGINQTLELAKKARDVMIDAFGAPIEAFMEQQRQVKQLGATFALLDQGGNSMEALAELAGDTEQAMGQLAIQTGSTGDDLVATFNNVVERGGKSVEQATALTEQMAYASRVVPGGLVGISEGFEKIQMGMINAKNPIVGLISATGTLKGSAKQVATEMKKMSIEKQMELSEKALGKMAEKAKQMPMTFGQSLNVLNEVKDNLLETAGGGLMQGLTKATLHIKDMFITPTGGATKLSNTITAAAEWFGNTFVHVFDIGTEFIDGLVGGASYFGDEMKLIWGEVFGESDATWKNMIEAGKYMGILVGGFVNALASGVGAIIIAIQKAIKYAMVAVGEVSEMVGNLTGSDTMKNFGSQAKQKAFGAEQEDLLAKMRKSGGGDMKELQTSYITNAGFTGQNDYMAKLQEAEKQRQMIENSVAIARNTANETNAKIYYEQFAYASKMQDEAAMKNIVSFMGNNAKMAEAIGKLGPDVLGAAKDDFTKMLGKMGTDSTLVDKFKAGTKADLKIAKGNVIQNFSGSISIKQDFKDSDPDRIMIAFKQKLSTIGTNKTTAKTNMQFG